MVSGLKKDSDWLRDEVMTNLEILLDIQNQP